MPLPYRGVGEGGFADPHPSRLRRATFPGGEGFLGVAAPYGVREKAACVGKS